MLEQACETQFVQLVPQEASIEQLTAATADVNRQYGALIEF